MKPLFIFLLTLCLLCDCSSNRSDNIQIQIISLEKISHPAPPNEDLIGEFYSINVDLINHSDSILKFWTESCSWQSNWIFDNKLIRSFVFCPKNIPVIKSIEPHKKITYNGVVELIGNEDIMSYDFKIGFVLVRTTDVYEESEVIGKLRAKIKNSEDIYWSDMYKLNKSYSK